MNIKSELKKKIFKQRPQTSNNNLTKKMAPAKGKKRKINTDQATTTSDEDFDEDTDTEITQITTTDPTQKQILKLLLKVYTSQKFMSNQFDTFGTRTTLLEKENSDLKREVSNLKNKVNDMERNINQLHQAHYNNYITISNIPITTNEQLDNITTKLADALKVKITTNDIVSSKRVTPNIKNATTNNGPQVPPVIIVELNSQNVKQQLLQNQKTLGPLTQNKLNYNTNNAAITKIYINEVLSTQNKKILFEAQKVKKKHNLKFVWARNGCVYIRANEGSIPTRIHSLEELAQFEEKLHRNSTEPTSRSRAAK